MNTYANSNTTLLKEDLLPLVSNNLKKMLDLHSITQKDLADLTQTAPATINSYINGKSLPGPEFLLALKNLYDISLDDFLTKSINPEDYLTPTEVATSAADLKEQRIAEKYLGTYYTYYFDTSHYKGRDANPADEALRYGVLHIYEEKGPADMKSYSCIAILGIETSREADSIKKQIEAFEDSEDIVDFIGTNYSTAMYHGSFDMGDKFVFLNMEHGDRDKALAIFYKVDSNKKLFRGGLGTINSVSKGREPMPTIQFLGISRDKVLLSAEEIQQALLLHHPNFKVTNEADELISLIKRFYIDDRTSNSELTELQKVVTVRANMERYITDSLKRNHFRYQKASNRDDDEWYHLLKHQTDGADNKYM